MNQKEIEQKKIIQEWLEKANADLHSAEIILKESKYYEITVYHAHQAVENFFKAKLLESGKTFKFIHDLNSLYFQVIEILPVREHEEDISFLNSLYPKLRYPTGEYVERDEAEKALSIARRIVKTSDK